MCSYNKEAVPKGWPLSIIKEVRSTDSLIIQLFNHSSLQQNKRFNKKGCHFRDSLSGKLSFFSGRIVRHSWWSEKQNPDDGFCEPPKVQRWLIILAVNLHLLTGMDNVSVFHLLDNLRICGKRVEKVSKTYWLNKPFFYFVARINQKSLLMRMPVLKLALAASLFLCLNGQAQIRAPFTNNDLRTNLSKVLRLRDGLCSLESRHDLPKSTKCGIHYQPWFQELWGKLYNPVQLKE